MDETIQINTRLTLAEYRKLRYRKDWWLLVVSVIIIIQFILIFPGMLHSIASGEVGQDSYFAFALAFLCFFIIPLFAIIRYFMLPGFIYKKNPFLEEGSQYSFTPQQIEWHSSIGEDTLYWSKIHHVRETDDFYLLYITRSSSMIINKRAFHEEQTDPNLEEKFRTLLSEKIPQKKLKLKKKNLGK